ncbi:GbpC/Spa domain-containing protein [Parvimonas micra]|uniref:Cell surface protein n=1 Tax=Parvimonas micra TaxID=33033 RepID=A0AAX3K704_9FIRM|nr:GbpC/Spa domain-containing protein [Parvimonas micra]WBB30863.1 cell surface protein [Parvimonas micra]
MKKREIIKKIVSMLMIFALVVPIASQAYAADPTRGVEVNADHSELDKAVQEAKASGVDVPQEQTQDKGTASSNSEADAKLAEVKADYENQIQKIKAAKLDMDNYNAKKKEYDKLKKKYDEDLAKYKIAKEKYDKELEAYKKALEDWKNHKNEDGYLSEPIDQPLVFKNEPNAYSSVSGKVYQSSEWLRELKYLGYSEDSEIYKAVKRHDGYATDEGAWRVYLENDKPLKITYSHLKNSTYNGKRIFKVEFKFTLKKNTSGKKRIPAILYYEPTKTINYSDLDANVEIDMEATFYDEDGKKIDMTGSLISFASLNRDLDKGVDRSEYVRNFNGKYLKINGSSIEAHNGKAISSIPSNEHKSHGSRFEVGEWDKHNSPKSWYGAIVGKAEGETVRVTFGANNRKAIWFAFNSDIKSYGVPIKPTEPEKPTPPKEPQKPEINVSYHYDIFYVKSQVEKKVTNANNQDINNKVVDTGSVVNFELKTSDFPKHHEKIESLVFTDTLPEGYQLDLEGTKANSPDYDVEYNEGTRLLKFTAKTSLLDEINRDLTKDAKVPSPKITGKVTKEGTKYENKFKISINNNYDVESDPVRVFTPKKPIKDVFDSQDTQVSIDKQTVKAGQELLYKVTYKNTTGKEQKVVIKDKIPEYTTYVENSADNGGVYDNGTITWTKEKVAADETFEVTFKVKVKDDVNGETIKNKANVLEGNNEYETNETTNPTSTKPKKDVFDSSAPQVSIDKQTVKAGQELLYKVTYKNTTGKEQKVVIKDKIPEYTTYVENSADNGGVYDNGVITWTKEKVAADETFEVTFKVKVKDDVNGEIIKNKADVLEGNNKYETNETTNPTSTKPKKDVFNSSAPQVSIDGEIVKAGQELLYKVTYKNTTGKEQKVVIKDKIPEYTTYVENSADNGGVYDNGTITWTKEKVAADETFEVTFKVKVKDDVNGETIKNKANVLEGNNKYETNETTNPTSTKPKKDVFNSSAPQVSIDGEIVKAGQELLYKVTYKNTTGKEQKVEIKDAIPEHTTYVEGSASDNGVHDNGVITWTKDKVAAGETFEVTFKVKVKDNVSGEIIKNKADVLEGNNKFETNETTNPTSTKPKKDVFNSSAPQVSIDGEIVKAGQELLYKVTYKNTTGKEQKVEIKDAIPEHTTYVEGSASDNGVHDNGVITWTKDKVAAGETFEVTFKVKVKDNVSGEIIKNKANVLEGNNKYETNETTNPTSTKPKKDVFDSSAPQVSIDKQTVKAGQELLYKVTYKNTTGKEQKVVIKDKIPEYTTYVENSADNGGVYDNGTITWTKEKVAADETFEVTFKVKVKDDVNGETIKNKANVLEGNNEYETNETTNPTSTKPKKDVFDSQDTQVSIDKQTVKAGQELLYKVTYKNTTGKEQKVVIKDKIPEYTTYVENSADNGGVYDNGTITWTKEKVAADETFEVTFKVKVKDDVNGETIKNKANVLEGNNEYETNETTNPTSTKPKKDVFDSSAPQVSIDKQTVKAGQELLYKVTYKNTTGKEQKVVIKDKIPEYTTYVENSADNGGVYDNGTITWTKEKVAADETFEVTFKVKVKDNVNGETIKNKANVLEGNNEYETNETTNPTSTKPKKDVFDSQNDQVSIDGQIVKAGQELLYKVTYKNTTGKDQKVEIKDKIPEYTTYVDGSASDGGVYKDGEITWTKEKVAADETFEVTFKVKVKDDVSGEVIKNKANVLEGNNKFETNETTNPTSTKPKKDVFDSQNDQVSIDGQIVKAGQELLYKVTYKNTTGKDQKVEIKDKIPEYTTYVDGSASDGGVYKDGEITWTKEKVAADETFEVTFKVKVKDDVSGEVIKNKANVLEGNNKFETNETTNPTSTKPKKDVFETKDPEVSIDGKETRPGAELLYKVTYKNTTGKEQKVEIKDTIPEHTTYVEGSASDGGVYKDGVITWTKEKVAADETFEVTFKVKVDENAGGNTVKNKANVLEGNNKFETNETTNPVSTKPVKDVFDSKNDKVSIDGKEVKAGQELLYKVTYKNTTGKEQKVVIKDAIPAHTKYVEGSADNNGVYENGVITWTKEKVAPGETFEVTFKVKVDENVNGEVIKNKANVLEGNNNYETNETTNPTPKKPGKEIPRTGFGANTALYTALLGLSTVALGGFRIRYKKKNNK